MSPQVSERTLCGCRRTLAAERGAVPEASAATSWTSSSGCASGDSAAPAPPACPAYGVCQDVTLRAIAAARPSSADELLAIAGMGPARVEHYGAEILAEVAQMRGARRERSTGTRRDGRQARNFSQYQLEVRQKHPRAWERWSDEEDARVVQLAESGKGVDEISAELERQPRAIELRMVKLGLLESAAAEP